MSNHDKWTAMDEREQRVLTTELLYLFRTQPHIFDKWTNELNRAKKKGLLDGLVLFPSDQPIEKESKSME